MSNNMIKYNTFHIQMTYFESRTMCTLPVKSHNWRLNQVYISGEREDEKVQPYFSCSKECVSNLQKMARKSLDLQNDQWHTVTTNKAFAEQGIFLKKILN